MQCSAVVVVMVLPTHKTENINLCSSAWCLVVAGSCSQGRPCAGAGNYHTGMCHKMIVNPDTAATLLSSPQSAIICTLGVMGHCQYRASLSLRLCDNEILGQFNTHRHLISRQLQWSNLRCPFIGKFNCWSENDGQLDMQENGKGFFDILVFGWSCLI